MGSRRHGCFAALVARILSMLSCTPTFLDSKPRNCCHPAPSLLISSPPPLPLPLSPHSPCAPAYPCAGTWCAMDDPNSSCVKQDGLATCVCKWGFAMTPDRGCVDTCTLKACVDGTCSKDGDGLAVCSCDAAAGFKLQLDGRTCKDVCVIEGCEAKDANSKCVRNLDVAHCECKTKFELFQGVCTGMLPRLTPSVPRSVSLRASACLLFVLSTFLCSLKLHFADSAPTLLPHPLRPSAPALPDTCVVKDCESGGGTCTQDADGVATCHCDAEAGFVLLADGRTCKDTCEVKACVDGTCSQDADGTASCHCDADAGLVLLEDGRTCKDVCIIKDCEGTDANSTCVKNGIDATCVCKTGFKLFEGKCI
ncbi:unnamed protein product, partial [Closterium sp. Naga37s-1]